MQLQIWHVTVVENPDVLYICSPRPYRAAGRQRERHNHRDYTHSDGWQWDRLIGCCATLTYLILTAAPPFLHS